MTTTRIELRLRENLINWLQRQSFYFNQRQAVHLNRRPVNYERKEMN